MHQPDGAGGGQVGYGRVRHPLLQSLPFRQYLRCMPHLPTNYDSTEEKQSKTWFAYIFFSFNIQKKSRSSIIFKTIFKYLPHGYNRTPKVGWLFFISQEFFV